jgi:hypothetical protein
MLRGTWQRRSLPEHGGAIQSCETHGSARAVPNRKVGSGAAGHMAALEPSLAGRRDLEPWNMWQRMGACSASRLDLKPVHGGTQSAGYQK